MDQFDRKKFGQAVSTYRAHRSYQELARETGIDPATLARLENGIRVNNFGAFKQLCLQMGYRVEDFPQPQVNAPRISHTLSQEQWGALIRLYRYRNNEYIRESAVGGHQIVANMGRLGLLESINMNFRRLPYVRISDAGIQFYETHERTYRQRYPELYQTSELRGNQAAV